MIWNATVTYDTLYGPLSFTETRSDFKDGEQPLHTGFKVKYRKARRPRIGKNDYRPYKNNLSFSWKDQSKRRNQYKRVPHFDLFERYERDECGIVMTDADIEQMCYLLNTYKCATI